VTPQDADALAARLELDLFTAGICLLCLTFVAFPLDSGDDAEYRRALRQFTPILWSEGLALPAQAALTKLARAGDKHAREALADIADRGARATIVRAIVSHLAADMVEDMRTNCAPVVALRRGERAASRGTPDPEGA
jgi:hypothetical protein